MPEFRGYELRTAREQAGLRLWQVAQEIHTSESCIRRWEGDEAEPSPEVIDQLEELYKCPMLWHRWMLSHSDSYRRHYSPVSDFEQEMERRKRYPTQEQENEVLRHRKKRNDLVARGLMNPDGTIARRRA